MRVLMLASYFPKPANTLMGNWALSQAQAFLRNGMEVSVVSGTSWIPRWAAFKPGIAAYANCPRSHRWGDLEVSYPRWLFYSAKPTESLLRSNPALVVVPAWTSIRRHLLEAVDQFRPDVLYAHHTQINGYLAWRLNRITGLPYVITDHDFGEIENCRTSRARWRFLQPVVAGSSRMIGVARRMERLIAEIFPGAKTATVHNGSEKLRAEAFSSVRPSDLSSRRVVFSACAFYERKGIPLLVKAFARIAPRFPDAVLRLAGDGATRPQIEAAVREAGMGSRIQLLGRIEHSQVLQEMIWADVFALPGWDEPFATAFTEALSAGCPIIYAADGGISDVVSDGVQGIAVEPKSEESLVTALVSILGDEPRRQAMGRAAEDLFNSKLLWNHNAQQMSSIFMASLSGSSPETSLCA